MLVTFTDITTGNSVAINPTQVACVFTAKVEEEEHTVINMLNGNIAVSEGYLDVVGKLQGELK
jgi:hypothetical protein